MRQILCEHGWWFRVILQTVPTIFVGAQNVHFTSHYNKTIRYQLKDDTAAVVQCGLQSDKIELSTLVLQVSNWVTRTKLFIAPDCTVLFAVTVLLSWSHRLPTPAEKNRRGGWSLRKSDEQKVPTRPLYNSRGIAPTPTFFALLANPVNTKLESFSALVAFYFGNPAPDSPINFWSMTTV